MRDFLRDFDLKGRQSAVVLGKGPSFERYEVGDFDPQRFLVVGINQVMGVVPVEVGVAAHVEPVFACKGSLSEIPCILMPYYPLYGVNTHHDVSLQRHWQNEVHCVPDNLFAYNTAWCVDRISRDLSRDVLSFGTTAHHILQLLTWKGIKEFIFYGIDGGKKVYGKKYYAESFHHDGKDYFESGKVPADFDSFWSFYFQFRRKHGLRYEFV